MVQNSTKRRQWLLARHQVTQRDAGAWRHSLESPWLDKAHGPSLRGQEGSAELGEVEGKAPGTSEQRASRESSPQERSLFTLAEQA